MVTLSLNLVIDQDVKKVLEFMQNNITSSKLVGVSSGVWDIAPIIWGYFERQEVRALALDADMPSMCESQPVAI